VLLSWWHGVVGGGCLEAGTAGPKVLGLPTSKLNILDAGRTPPTSTYAVRKELWAFTETRNSRAGTVHGRIRTRGLDK
jgi:hypothetical protein